MRRRDFIKVIAGVGATWPFAVYAQQQTMRLVGMLNGIAADDKEAAPRVATFREALRKLGWIEGSNIRIEHRWVVNDPEKYRSAALELVALRPDVLVGHSSSATNALRAATTSIPIIFFNILDPVASGLVESFARPGGNITGFANFEPAMGGKWINLLKEIYPSLTRVCLVYNPKTVPWFSLLQSKLEPAAASLGLTLVLSPFSRSSEVESAIEKSASEQNTGLFVLPDISTLINRGAIISAAARHRLPAIYPFRFFVDEGGLISYGVDNVAQYRGVASYVDRILKGAKASDLPVQEPNKFELVINLKTAKALALEIPPTLLTTADEVIE